MFRGSIVAMVTPLTETGEVDYIALEKLIAFHIDQQTDAIVSVGTTGESATLSFSEHCKVIEKSIEFAQNHIPIIAGTGANATEEAIKLTQCAKDIGAKACLSVTPYYNKPTQEGLYRHFSTIAEKTGLPTILYNVPGRTGCDLLPETVAKLINISNIIGIKEASNSIERMAILKNISSDLLVYSGDDHLILTGILEANIDGVISVTANVVPKMVHDLCKAAFQGNKEEAFTIYQKLETLNQHLFLESNPIPVKWALYKMGYISSTIRLPLTPLAEKYRATLENTLQEMGLLT